MATEEIADWGIDWGAILKPKRKVPGSGIVSAEDSLGLHLDQGDVMPTGKTAEDKCGKCFVIHSNGQTECW